MKKFMLKVFQGKSNGQLRVNLPKKQLAKMPTMVEVRIPKEYVKQKPRRGEVWF